MPLFRRRPREDEEPAEVDETTAGAAEPTEPDGDEAEPARSGDGTLGPYDSVALEGMPEVAAVPRVDLGSMLIPVLEGVEVRVDMDGQTSQVVSATLATATSLVQVTAFAAPRTAGIWAEVRAEIAESLAGGAGSVEQAEGRFGPELRARVPTDTPGELTTARFLGVDGPRWFLRGLVQGALATDDAADPALLDAFAQTVVARGGDAMAVRDPLPLRLPPEALAAAEQGLPPEPDAPQVPQVPQRGPEMTETA